MSGSRSLSERQPPPPAELSAAIARALSQAEDRSVARGGGETDDEIAASQLVVAAERFLPRVIVAECEKRSGALNLLTLDALITYSMEASSTDSIECEATAAALLAAIGTTLGAQ